jgi:hypothetical protein
MERTHLGQEKQRALSRHRLAGIKMDQQSTFNSNILQKTLIPNIPRLEWRESQLHLPKISRVIPLHFSQLRV